MKKKAIVWLTVAAMGLSLTACGVGSGSSGSADEESWEINVYYVDEEQDTVVYNRVEVSDEEDIWAALQDVGMITVDSEMNSFSIDQETSTISIDFGYLMGERFRNMGETEEYEVLTCIVNTFLDAYDCEYVLFTEDGETFVSSSTVYEGGIEREEEW